MELRENSGMKKYIIELIKSNQPLYGPIYSIRVVELETLKIYNEPHLKTRFIRSSNSLAGDPIFFDKKPYGSLCLFVNYWDLNNLTIKNHYLFPLIDKSLDRLGCAKRFTQLDLTSAFDRMRIQEGEEWKLAFHNRYGHF